MIKRNRISLFLMISVFFLSFMNIFAAGPGTIMYQGTIFQSNERPPADGAYEMSFSLWNVEEGGDEETNRKWKETWKGQNGIHGSYTCISSHINDYGLCMVSAFTI